MNKNISSLIRSHFLDLKPYVSAGMESGKDESQVFMNANENPFSIDGLEGLNFYPEQQPPALIKAMAQTYGVQRDQLLVTRGEDEALKLLTDVFCEPHQDSVLIHTPTFGMYGVNAQAMPCQVIDVPLIKGQGTFSLDTKKMIKTALNPDHKIKLVYLCSPNNPTSTVLLADEISEICRAVEGKAIVILDEAYAEFSAQDGLVSKLADHNNLIILRTLSKAYGLAGIRIGAMLCDDAGFIQFMAEKVLDIYPLPLPSIAAALSALDPKNQQQAKDNMKQMLTERDRLKEHLNKSSFVHHIYPSDANFLLIEVEDPKGLCAYALENGFVLRDFSDKQGTENCIRISPALPDQNTRFLAIFDQFVEKLAA